MNQELHPSTRPYLFVGAGRMTALLWKLESSSDDGVYRFSIVAGPRGIEGACSHFEPADLESLIKLVQVLASVLVDDGCLPPVVRERLSDLTAHLDRLTTELDHTSTRQE